MTKNYLSESEGMFDCNAVAGKLVFQDYLQVDKEPFHIPHAR